MRNGTGQVVSMAVVVATGMAAGGSREVLGTVVGDSEDETFWRGFLTSLKSRGLTGVRLVINDQRAGLVKALNRCFQGAGHQRCRVHFTRNLLAHVGRDNTDKVAATFRTIFAQPNSKAVAAAWDEVRDRLAASFPKIGPLMDAAKGRGARDHRVPESALAEDLVDEPARAPQQGDQAPVPRRRDLPANNAAVIRLLGAILADTHDEWQAGDRRYLSGGSMDLLYPDRDAAIIAAIVSGE